jgi:hypothetical protein
MTTARKCAISASAEPEGDVLVFTSLSRVACSMIHMIEIEAAVAAAGASIQILDMNVDTNTPQGRLTFNLFGSITQFERENMLERQKVGIAAAKAEGKYTGAHLRHRPSRLKCCRCTRKDLPSKKLQMPALSVSPASTASSKQQPNLLEARCPLSPFYAALILPAPAAAYGYFQPRRGTF